MKIRLRALHCAVFAVLLGAATAQAQGPYSLTGKAATGSGQAVRLPGIGVPCTEIRASGAVGVNLTQKYAQPATIISMVANPGGCIPGSAASVTTTGSGGFMLPVMFFDISAPGMLNVVAIPGLLAVPQLATSFAFTGPALASTPFNPQRARKGPIVTMGTTYAGTPKFTPASWNVFRASAHLTPSGSSTGSFTKLVAGLASGTGTPSMGSTSMQPRAYLNKYVSGRTSANFTACAQSPAMAASVACTFPSQGTLPALVKNIAGPRVFGGTMDLVLTTGGANTSSVAVTVAGGYSSPGGMNTMATRGSIVFNALSGTGSRPQGRGYAAYNTEMLMAANRYTSHMLTTTYMSLPYYSRLVGNVGMAGLMLPSGTNRNFGFPWTTGTQVIRATGKSLNGGPGGGTLTLKGFDTRMTPMGATGMGGEGNIQLVSASIAQALPLNPFSGVPAYSAMRLSFAPEPGAAAGMLAGAASLLVLVACRRRRR